MSLWSTLNFIFTHPLNQKQKGKALQRFLQWQIQCRLSSGPSVIPFAENSIMKAWKGLSGATGNLYAGLYEFEEMAFALHFLRHTDCLIDAGANIGSYTILGASERGSEVLAVEPVPAMTDALEANITLNEIGDRVTLFKIGLSSKEDMLLFTTSYSMSNHVATKTEEGVCVPVRRLDDLVTLQKPTLLKLDVEGYEYEVLRGMPEGLANNNLKAIIIELNGSGARYGYNETDIHRQLLKAGFHPYDYFPFERRLIEKEQPGHHNTLYIRDKNFVEARVQNARVFSIHGKSF